MMHREVKVYECECARCGHKWATRYHELPKVCSRCRSRAWDLSGASGAQKSEAGRKKGVMPNEHTATAVAVTGASPRGDETGATVESGVKGSAVQKPSQPSASAAVPQVPRHEASPLASLPAVSEKRERIRQRYNMDSRDCLECGVSSGIKHKGYCAIGDRLARENDRT